MCNQQQKQSCLHHPPGLLRNPPTCSLEASAVECIRTSVPRSEAVASSLPSSDSAMHTSGELCAWMNLVRRTSYSSTRTCSTFLSCCAACRRPAGGVQGFQGPLTCSTCRTSSVTGNTGGWTKLCAAHRKWYLHHCCLWTARRRPLMLRLSRQDACSAQVGAAPCTCSRHLGCSLELNPCRARLGQAGVGAQARGVQTECLAWPLPAPAASQRP